MKKNSFISLLVYRKKEPTSYRREDGKAALSFKITCDDGEEVDDIKISEEAYEMVEKGKAYIFACTYSEYGGRGDIRLTQVVAELPDSNNLEHAIPDLIRTGLANLASKAADNSANKAAK